MFQEGKALGGGGGAPVGGNAPGRASAAERASVAQDFYAKYSASDHRLKTGATSRRYRDREGADPPCGIDRHHPDTLPRGTVRRRHRTIERQSNGTCRIRQDSNRVSEAPLPHGRGSEGRAIPHPGGHDGKVGGAHPTGRGSDHRSPRVDAVTLHFGLGPMESKPDRRALHTLPALPSFGIVLITGSSGSGKSTALATIQQQYSAARCVDQSILHRDTPIIDQVAPWAELAHAAGLLTACGLGEPRLWLRCFHELSDGERFRAQLAVGLALHERDAATVGPVPLLCDEFAAMLHRRSARAIAFNLRKLATRGKRLLVLAASQEDFTADLRPDLIVRIRGLDQEPLLERSINTDATVFSLRRRLHIVPGGKRDYATFAAMHYRRSDELGFVDQVFVLREKCGGEPLGIIVYAHAPLELALRNEATDGYFRRRPERVNAELRTIRRLVIHPDVRGCGLGHWLIRKTLPLIGTPFIETQTSLGEFNPVFERAGMTRVGQRALGKRRRALLDELKQLDADPGDADFIERSCRDARLRQMARQTVQRWYAATTGGGRMRVMHQTPELRARLFRGIIATRPVYYLWRKPRSHEATKGKKEKSVRPGN